MRCCSIWTHTAIKNSTVDIDCGNWNCEIGKIYLFFVEIVEDTIIFWNGIFLKIVAQKKWKLTKQQDVLKKFLFVLLTKLFIAFMYILWNLKTRIYLERFGQRIESIVKNFFIKKQIPSIIFILSFSFQFPFSLSFIHSLLNKSQKMWVPLFIKWCIYLKKKLIRLKIFIEKYSELFIKN